MTTFDEDVRAQAGVLRRVFDAYGDRERGPLAAASVLADDGAPIIFAGMGSSLSAARSAAARLASLGWTASAAEASELLHYGLSAIPTSSTVVLVSQSGRSAETLALARRLKERGGTRLAAVVNDERSPLAHEAATVFPMLAGEESTVSTKTFVATLIVVNALADAISGRGGQFLDDARASGLVDLVADVSVDQDGLHGAAENLANVDNLIVVARGPSLVAADYAALIVKETAAVPAEAMSGGSFRHGPMEIVGPSVGLVVLAPDGETRELSIRLAAEMARLGSPVWLLTDVPHGLNECDGLVISCLPRVPERLAPVLSSIALQRFAAELARRRGREPGVFRYSTKVTDVE